MLRHALDPEMFSYHGMFMFFYALMEMAASAQITCLFIYYTSLVYQGRLFFRNSQMISDLFAYEHALAAVAE